MKRIQKNFIIIFIIMFLFSFSVSVFADSSLIDLEFTHLYSYNAVKDNNITSLEAEALKTDYVISGDFTYFIFYDIGRRGYKSVVIRTSKLDSNIVLDFQNYSQDGYNCFYLPYSHTDDLTKPDYYCLSGNPYYTHCDNGDWCFSFSGQLDSDNKCFNIPFATNFKGDIYFKHSDNSKSFLSYSKPYIFNTNEELQNMSTTLNIVPRSIPESTLYFKIFDSEGQEVLSTALKDFLIEDNYHRIDPFSDLCYYSVDWSKLPKFSLSANNSYDFRIQYTLDGNLYNISRFINVLVNYSNGSGRR